MTCDFFGIGMIRIKLLFLTVLSCVVSGEAQNEVTKTNQKIGNIFCALLHCQGLSDSSLEACYTINCKGVLTQPNTKALEECVEDKCSGYEEAHLQMACSYLHCRQHLASLDAPRTRRGDDDFFWPDDMETRSMDDIAQSMGRALNAEQLGKKDTEHEVAVKSQGCSCHGYTGHRYTMCMVHNCGRGKRAHNMLNVHKRWSTRLCMEAHCQGIHSKVEYFLCGKQMCH